MFEDPWMLRAHAACMEELVAGSPRVALLANGAGGAGLGWK